MSPLLFFTAAMSASPNDIWKLSVKQLVSGTEEQKQPDNKADNCLDFLASIKNWLGMLSNFVYKWTGVRSRCRSSSGVK